MGTDLQKILKIDLSYPGISFGLESWALEIYLKLLNDHLSFAQDQYRLRAERELDRKRKSLEPEEVHLEMTMIDEAVETHIPRFFRNGALVQIWGLFESFVFDIAHYVGKKEKVGLVLRDIRASNFRQQVEKYFEGALRIDLPWTPEERAKLGQLQELRNFVAHRNGRATDLSPEKLKDIQTLVSQVPGVWIDESLMLSSEYIQDAAGLVFGALEKLNKLVGGRYDGPSV
jgi:hypothetical protein